MEIFDKCRKIAIGQIVGGIILFSFGLFARNLMENFQNATVLQVIGILFAVSGEALLIYSKVEELKYRDNQKKHKELLNALTGVTYTLSGDSKTVEEQQDYSLLANGGWKCDCGKINAGYVSTCSCGKSKRDVLVNKKQV